MSDTKLGADDVRALFSDHLEGSLEPSVQREVEALLAGDPGLEREYRAFARTVELLRALPSSDAPDGLVGKVRDRLAAERRQQQHGQHAQQQPVPSPKKRSRAVEVFAGFAACAAVAAVAVVGVPALQGERGGAGTLTAGTGAVSAVSLSWRAPGVARADVEKAAAAAGMEAVDGGFAGDRQAAARFLVQLKTVAAAHGADVSGHVPEAAERVVVVVVP